MDFLHLPCRRFQDGHWTAMEDLVAPETPVTLRWAGSREAIRLSAYAVDLPTLALGHALLHCCAEGELPEIVSHDGFDLTLAPRPGTRPALRPWRGPLAPQTALAAMSALLDAPGFWMETGCFHRAGLWDPALGRFLVTVEDIPRHNCVDRLAGWGLQTGRSLTDLVLCISARTTSSLMEKIVRLGTPVVCTRAAPTSLGLDLARAHGITLAAYVKPTRLSVFHDPQQRIAGGPDHETHTPHTDHA
ncbi:MAG: formate dehydrogenase accessory sulfurtransferase FdhD [Desulfovibrio sp.]|nr:formate dehydrogenase accessory sulfurtransferase FdhD [Desulfovibrio sp.]